MVTTALLHVGVNSDVTPRTQVNSITYNICLSPSLLVVYHFCEPFDLVSRQISRAFTWLSRTIAQNLTHLPGSEPYFLLDGVATNTQATMRYLLMRFLAFSTSAASKASRKLLTHCDL